MSLLNFVLGLTLFGKPWSHSSRFVNYENSIKSFKKKIIESLIIEEWIEENFPLLNPSKNKRLPVLNNLYKSFVTFR